MAIDRALATKAAACTLIFLAGAASAHAVSYLASHRKYNRRHKVKGKRKHPSTAPNSIEAATSAYEFAHRDVEPLNLRHVNKFLSWDCAATLLDMGLFPNAQEVTESMACLHAVDLHLKLRFSEPDILCVVVGDGVVPRTGALFAMRTKWNQIISVDPAMLEMLETQSQSARKQVYARKQVTSKQSLERRRLQLERLREVQRLEMLALPIENALITIRPDVKSVVLILPHAHVVPDLALGAFRLESEASSSGNLPSISVVQIPCCKYVKHNTVCGAMPDVEYVDTSICGHTHGKRTIRVWADVAGLAVSLRAVRIGDRVALSHRIMEKSARYRKAD